MDSITIVIFVAGLFLGTLLNVVVIRLPRERNLRGWPRCTRCGVALAWWQVLPMAGWLAQGGRARCCGRRLKLLFPLIELTTGAVLAIFYTQYHLSVPFWYLTFVAAVLIVTGAIDWLHRSIYTFVILSAALLALLATAVAPIHSFPNALFGALVAGLVFAVFFVLARVLFPGKSSPFGLGDVYLGIFIGAAVGLTNLLPSLFYGILLAGIFSAVLILAKRVGRAHVPEYISYGTFLCLGALGYLVRWGLGGG
jgi:leader peptidase (prepilin peptidase)/N-methyltransferase